MSNPILETMKETMDRGDMWGEVLSWHFTVCDMMRDCGFSYAIPEHWDYSPGLGGPARDTYEYTAIAEALEPLQWDDMRRVLIYAGEVLHRVANVLRLQGEDY